MDTLEGLLDANRPRLTSALLAAVLGGTFSFVADAQPSAPKGLAAVPSDAEAILSWTGPSDDAITSYSVRYATSDAELSSPSAPAWTAIAGSGRTTSKHTVSSLTNGDRYHFQIRAASADGAGPPSNVATTRLAAEPSAVVAINDSGLREALERRFGLTPGTPITQLQIATLVSLDSPLLRISDLAGLEYAVNLHTLSLVANRISDIAALGSLESLRSLDLTSNRISDISVLGSLEYLRELRLQNNRVSDVSALGSLEYLTILELYGNAVSDVSELGSFESLRELYLGSNSISDVSPLGSLTSLTELDLSENSISDVSALGSLQSLTELSLGDNSISDVSPLGSLESLTRWLFLWDNSISDVSALGSLTSLTALDLSGNSISDVSALGSLKSLTRLWLTSNSISDVSGLGSLESLRELYLANNSISDASGLGSLESLRELHLQNNSFSDVPEFSSLDLDKLFLQHNSISDVSALGSMKSSPSTLHLHDNAISDVSALGSIGHAGPKWRYLRELHLQNNLISDVSGLGSLESLRELHLHNNLISDVSRLESLESLARLYLSNNAISDVSALGSLRLGELHLQDNLISDVSGLGSLRNLRELNLSNNWISDVSELGSLRNLRELTLYNNLISDVSAFGSLQSPTGLYLTNNSISDVSALGSLQSLTTLTLSNNSISDVSALASLQSLRWLLLGGNSISDVSALGSLQSLRQLDLQDNSISDVSVLASLQSLRRLRLSDNSISDVSALGSLQSLLDLHLQNNSISDISALGNLGMSSSRRAWTPFLLALAGNRIADIAPLVAADLDAVGLRGNPLSADAIERHVPALRAAGTGVMVGWPVPFFPSAADPSGHQGFVRVVNRSDVGGEVLIDAVDDSGEHRDPVRLALGAGEAAHFNSDDLETGNVAKMLSGSVGALTRGSWRLELWSTLDIEVLSYIRTRDGFLTSMHDMLPRAGGYLRVPIFNPGSNKAQRSSLRLTYPGGYGASVSVSGVDDRGRRSDANEVETLWRTSLTVSAAALEAHGLGNGAGKWRLEVWVRWPAEAVSLLTSPGGHVTNLSTAPAAGADGVWRMPLFPADDTSDREGFVRVANRRWRAGEVAVVAVDDSGARFGPVTLALKAGQTVHLNSGDLERGNAEKGLPTGVGPPAHGDWRLELTSELDIAVTSYVRTADGFLTSMHDLAPPGVAAQTARVPIFNPGSNRRQASLLRVINDGDAAATVTVTGVDDAGTPGGEVRLTVPAGEARTWTAADLEAGGEEFEGGLGDGVGKWRLTVASDVPVSVMSLLRSPGGHLTNLSTSTRP